MKYSLLTIAALFIANLCLTGNADAQVGIFDRLRLKADGPSIDFAPSDDSANRFRLITNGSVFNLDTPDQFAVLQIARDANTQALVINGTEINASQDFRVSNSNPRLLLEDADFVGDEWEIETGGFNEFNVDSPSQFNVFEIQPEADAGSLVLTGTGVGIGTVGPEFPGLHVRSSDFGAFQDATLLVENAESTTAAREQMRLRNNGPARLALQVRHQRVFNFHHRYHRCCVGRNQRVAPEDGTERREDPGADRVVGEDSGKTGGSTGTCRRNA